MLEEGSNCLFLLVCCPDRVPRCLGWLRAAGQSQKAIYNSAGLVGHAMQSSTVGNVCDRGKLIALRDLQAPGFRDGAAFTRPNLPHR